MTNPKQRKLSKGRLIFPSVILPAIISVLVGASPAVEGKEGERGLFRFVPKPFKKEQSETDAAVEDMRKFAAELTGQTGTGEPPAEEAQEPPASDPAPEIQSPDLREANGDQEIPSPQAEEAGEPKGERRRLLKWPKRKNAEAPPQETVEPATEQTRKKWIRLPFSGRDASPGSTVAEQVPAVQGAPPEAPGIPEVSGAPEVESGVEVSSGELADQLPETAPTERKRKRLFKLSSPFSANRDEVTEVVQAEEEIGGGAEIAVAADNEPEPVGEQKTRWLRLPIGAKSKDKVEPQAGEVAVAEDEALAEPIDESTATAEAGVPETKTKKGLGLFGWLGGASSEESDALDALPSDRDLGTGDKYVITADSTPFYSIGPTQPLPPDEILDEGMLVTMRKAGWGWSDVELPGGQMGVVSTKNLRRATAAETGGGYVAGRASSRGLWKVFDYNPAPEPDLPSDSGGIPLGAGLLPPLDPHE